MQLARVENLNIPDVISLSAPSANLKIGFENDAIQIDCPQIVLERPQSKIKKGRNTSKESLPFDLPCNVKVLVHNASLADKSTVGTTTLMKCRHLDLTLQPVYAQVAAPNESPGAGMYLKCVNYESSDGSTIVRVPVLGATGLIQFDQLDRIGNFAVSIERAELLANFSSVSWSSSLETKDEEPLMLPYASVQKFDLTLKYAGKLVDIKDAKLCCDAFEGDIATNLDSLSSHYVSIVKRRIPYLLAKTEVLGANVGDSVGVMASTIATNSSLLGATVGFAARDAIGGSITKGKEARGASSTEKYKFGE